jgi:zinc protease
MALVTRYLGSLPARERISAATLDDLRKIAKVPGPRTTQREVTTATKLAVVVDGFYGADMDNVVDTRCLQLASRILSTRMTQTIREKEQLAYSPNCGHRPGVDFPGFGLFIAAIPTEPAKVDRLVQVVDEMFAAFAKDGPTEEEMTTVRKQVANAIDEQMKEPGFWTGRLSQLSYRDTKLNDIMNSAEENQKYTAEQIKDTFNKYYKPEAVVKVVIKPAAEQGQAQGGPSGEDKPKPSAQ